MARMTIARAWLLLLLDVARHIRDQWKNFGRLQWLMAGIVFKSWTAARLLADAENERLDRLRNPGRYLPSAPTS